jgi:hypothetical protein
MPSGKLTHELQHGHTHLAICRVIQRKGLSKGHLGGIDVVLLERDNPELVVDKRVVCCER